MGNSEGLSTRVLERTWACVRWFQGRSKEHWSGEGAVRKWGRFYDYLSESSYKVGELIKAKVVIGKGAARQVGRLVIFVVWKTLMFVCLLRHDYRVVLFLSWSITVTESYLTSMFCEIIYVQQENAKADPWGSSQLPDVRGCFSLCHTLSTRVLSSMLPSPQNSMVKFTLKSQFLHIWGVFVWFSLGVYM